MFPALSSRMAAEVVGTFLLVLLGPGAALTVFNIGFDAPGLLVIALGHGLGLMVGVYAFAAISGAHFNPSVTIALAATKRFPWKEVPSYLLAQTVGAIAAAGVLWATWNHFAVDVGLGTTHLDPNFNAFNGLLAEALGTFVLVTVIFAIAVDPRGPKSLVGFGIGLGLVGAILTFGPISGASLNLARTLGPEIMLTIAKSEEADWGNIWIYIVGPILGGLIAAFAYDLIARPKEAEEVLAKPEAPAPKPQEVHALEGTTES